MRASDRHDVDCPNTRRASSTELSAQITFAPSYNEGCDALFDSRENLYFRVRFDLDLEQRSRLRWGDLAHEEQ